MFNHKQNYTDGIHFHLMNDLNALNKLDSKCTWNTRPIEMKTMVIEPRDNTVCDHTIF